MSCKWLFLIVGQGLNINGLNIKHATGTYTSAQCKTLGGWLKFQNFKESFTKVYDSYGEWTFS